VTRKTQPIIVVAHSFRLCHANTNTTQVILMTSPQEVMADFGEESPYRLGGSGSTDEEAAASPQLCTMDNANTTCSICLLDYEHGEDIRRSYHCKHVFHSQCMLSWLLSSSGQQQQAATLPSCPYCRKAIVLPEDVERLSSKVEQE
jgi:hypothetical protein